MKPGAIARATPSPSPASAWRARRRARISTNTTSRLSRRCGGSSIPACRTTPSPARIPCANPARRRQPEEIFPSNASDPMRLASFKVDGRTSYGAVTDNGINYPDRSAEYKDGKDAPKYPNLFCRFPTSLVGSGQPIVRPKVSDKFDYEGEVVLVMGKEGRHVPRENALAMIGGVTLGNEGSVRHCLRPASLNVTQGKKFNTSGSLGPWIVTTDEVDPAKPLHLTTRVNGEVRQEDSTDRLTWGFAWLINYISTFATLKPGDLIWTGTPTGAGVHRNPSVWLQPCEGVEGAAPQIGVLRNTVVDEV